MGFRSLLAPGLVIGVVLFGLTGMRFIVRVLSLSPRVDSLLTASRTQTIRLSSKLNFDSPTVIGQAVAAVGVLALGLVFWRFQDLLRAVSTLVSTDRNLMLRVAFLRPHHLEDAGMYRVVLQMLLLFFSISIMRIVRIRARRPVREGGGALAMVVMLLVLTLLAAEFPYRFVWKNNFERISVESARCYAIGEATNQVLAFCPDVRPPRNRIIGRDDQALRRSGVVESIFTPLEDAR
jgi:hypothetical protein